MNRIDAPTLLTIIYVLVDDWYQEQGYRLTPMLPGPEPSFRDSEMLTFWFIPSSLLILTNAPAAESVLQFIQGNNILADKGFIGTDWQTEISRTTGNRVSTAKRVNQHQQTSPVFERLLQHFRERIEGVFNEMQNTGRNLERLLRKKVEGLCVHVAAKMASHTLRILLRQLFGIDVLTFEQTPVQPFGQLI